MYTSKCKLATGTYCVIGLALGNSVRKHCSFGSRPSPLHVFQLYVGETHKHAQWGRPGTEAKEAVYVLYIL